MSNEDSRNPEDDPSHASKPSGFGLNEPTGQFDDLERRLEAESSDSDSADAGQPLPTPDPEGVSYRNMGWKGIDDAEPDEIDEEPDVTFGAKEPIPEDELDMTPMVDVTFLLLIFFMVTASFTLQKSLEQPHAKSDDPSTQVREDDEEIVDDYVQVLIDQTNTYYVTTRDEDEVECPSESEMRAKVKDGFESANAQRLIIIAHVDSLHSKVVTAWDAGVVNNANKIEIQTTDEDY